MILDIIRTDDPEPFIKMAQRLGIDSLAVISKQKVAGDNLFWIKEGSTKDLKRAGADSVLVKGSDRIFFEHPSVDMIYGLEDTGSKEFMHHRNSGLNQILARLAKEKDKTIIFALPIDSRNCSQILGRMRQNVRICRKFGVRMRIASFADDPYLMRSPNDMISFGVVIGMHPSEAKAAVQARKR